MDSFRSTAYRLNNEVSIPDCYGMTIVQFEPETRTRVRNKRHEGGGENSKEQPINISGHIEWGRSGWAVTDKNFFTGEGNTAVAAKGHAPRHGDTFQNGSTCLT